MMRRMINYDIDNEIMYISESDIQNGNIPTNSKHGSLCTLNMEWDSQGLGSVDMNDMNCFIIKLF